jgi:hypothetical protein
VTEFNAGEAYWNQRGALAERRQRLQALIQAVDWPGDLTSFQWAQLMATALEFRPDVIVELGRGYGNSTCAFVEASHLLGGCRVISICTSFAWERRTLARLQGLADDAWFRPLQALRQDILQWQPVQELRDARRVLVFWDAHGFEVAEWVLGALLPALKDRPHVVAMHDMLDARYHRSSYRPGGMWKGGNARQAHVYVGGVISAVEQAVAVVDFTSRNGIALQSAEHQNHLCFDGRPDDVREMQDLLGPLFSLTAMWHWFTTEGVAAEYPPFRPRSGLHKARVALRQLAAATLSQRIYRR